MCKLFESSVAGSGVAAAREVRANAICSSGLRRNSKFGGTLGEPVTAFSVSGLVDVPYTEECTNPPSRDEVLSSRRSSVSSTTGTISSLTDSQDERIRVKCDVCGYTCTLHWLNDQPKCLKCQSELKRRSNVQQRRGVAASLARSLRISATPPGTPTPTRPRSQSLPNTEDTLCHGKRSSTENDVDVFGDIQKLVLLSRENKSTDKRGVQISVNGHRVFMKCIECGNQCLPHWSNDVAHCCKCQAVLRQRPNAHRTKSLAAGSTRSHQRRSGTP